MLVQNSGRFLVMLAVELMRHKCVECVQYFRYVADLQYLKVEQCNPDRRKECLALVIIGFVEYNLGVQRRCSFQPQDISDDRPRFKVSNLLLQIMNFGAVS